MATQIQTRVFCRRRLLVINRHKESQREKKKKKKPNPSPFSSSSFSPFQWPEKETHKKDEKTTTTTKTQPGTAGSLKTRYQEKLMKPKREKAHTPKQNPEKRFLKKQ
jgi:hypothetical protein